MDDVLKLQADSFTKSNTAFDENIVHYLIIRYQLKIMHRSIH